MFLQCQGTATIRSEGGCWAVVGINRTTGVSFDPYSFSSCETGGQEGSVWYKGLAFLRAGYRLLAPVDFRRADDRIFVD